MEKGGIYHDFFSKLFCLTVPKNFVEESFSVSEISGMETFFWMKGGYQEMPSKLFRHTVPEYFVVEHICFRSFLGSKDYLDKRAGGRKSCFFLTKLICLTVPKHFVEKSFLVSETIWYGNILCIKGHITILRRNCFVSQYRNTS